MWRNMLHGSNTNPVQIQCSVCVKVSLVQSEKVALRKYDSRSSLCVLKEFQTTSYQQALGNIMQQLSQEMFSRRIGVAGGGGGASAMSQQRQEVTSGHETPVHFATEDTPAIFSRNDSLSSLSCNEESTETPSKGNTLYSLPEVITKSWCKCNSP